MTDQNINPVEPVDGFEILGAMMRYNLFAPRLYNWCLSLGFESGKIMPSRAFCSDESQGYPIIMLAKHFGTFPFNHGMVGGIVATDRHGPHADHGQDLVIIQASHVGYDPQSSQFGTYRRLQTTNQECASNCGKIHNALDWYESEYQFAQNNISFGQCEGKSCIMIDNQLLQEDRTEGLFLQLEKIIESDKEGHRSPLKILSTAKVFQAASGLIKKVDKILFEKGETIGERLTSDLFYFRRDIPQFETEGTHHLEQNLIHYMPQIITSSSPMLVAAQINTQIEFDRTFRTIVKEQGYQGKNILFISGLNIDISPQAGQLFPLTKFVPWAAYLQDKNNNSRTFEQKELVQLLNQQPTENPDQINLEDAIQIMAEAQEVKIRL